MTRTVPFPLDVAEMKTQPSLERVNVNDWLDCELEETSSSSETRLLSFRSPEKRISASAALPNPQTIIPIAMSHLGFINQLASRHGYSRFVLGLTPALLRSIGLNPNFTAGEPGRRR